jgi:ankyrin repeat protein
MKVISIFQLLAVSLLISSTLYATTREGEMPKVGMVQQRLADLRRASGQSLSTVSDVAQSRRLAAERQEQNKLNEELLVASWNGDIKRVEQLLRDGAAINVIGSNGYTPLMRAIDRALLKDIQGRRCAVVAKMLISAGADVNMVTPAPHPYLKNLGITHVTPLFAACEGPLMAHLIAHGADVAPVVNAWKLMGIDISSKDLEVYRKLFFVFIDFLKNPDDFLSQNHDNKQLLNEMFLFCIAAGRADLVQKLVAHGVDVNAVERENHSALDCALIMNDPAMISLILRLTSSFVNSPKRDGFYLDPQCLLVKPALMTLKLLAEKAVKNMTSTIVQPAAPEINSSAAHAAALAPASQDPQILADREIREQQDRDYEEAVAIDTAIAASLAEQAEVVAPVELIVGNEEAAEATPSPEELRAIQLQAIEKRS